jgi:putative transposase
MSRRNRYRETPRAKWHDYRQPGVYFVTFTTDRRERWLGVITDTGVALSAAGNIAADVIRSVPSRYPNAHLCTWVVMPDHVHALIELTAPDGVWGHPLTEIVRGIKALTSRRVNEMAGTPGKYRWDKSFHDRIVRDAGEQERIHRYIERNPAVAARRHTRRRR